MCYYVYGAVNKEVSAAEAEALSCGSEYRFRPGTKHDIKMAVVRESQEFRVTDWYCDCDFPAGMGDPEAEELTQLAALLGKLRQARNAKCVYLCKTWTGERNKNEETVHIDDVSLPEFLAGMRTQTLYRIDLYPRFA